MTGIQLTDIQKKIPRRSIIVTVLTIFIISFYLLFSIFPTLRSIGKIKDQKKRVKAELLLQEKMIPVFTKVRQYSEYKFDPSLPFAVEKAADQADLGKILNQLQLLAAKHKLKITDNRMDRHPSGDSSDLLSVQFDMEGQFSDFRLFLISVVSLPFCNALDQINFHTNDEGVNTFSMKAVIEIKNQP